MYQFANGGSTRIWCAHFHPSAVVSAALITASDHVQVRRPVFCPVNALVGADSLKQARAGCGVCVIGLPTLHVIAKD